VPRTTFKKKLFRLGIWLLLLLLWLELVCRVFWWYERKASVFSTNILWQSYYPQMLSTGVLDTSIRNDDETFDVLILGGSVISDGFGTIGTHLGQALQERLGRPVRVYNLAFAAHNTRDCLLKYRLLAPQRFDLVVFYDAINDTRMNNTPPGQFRDDYSHCRWYKHLNLLDRQPWLAHIALPSTMVFLWDSIAENTGLGWFLPRLNPDDHLVEFASDIRTRGPYQAHLREIVETAQHKHERVILSTFASFFPKNPQDGPPTQVRMWGKEEYVVAALEQHNDALRELAAQHPEVILVEQDHLIPRSKDIFIDCCHFTPAGCSAFVRNVLERLNDNDLTSVK